MSRVKPHPATWQLALLLILTACSGSVERLFPAQQPAEIYRPPALAASSTPVQSAAQVLTATSTLAAEAPPTPACLNNLLFVEDLSVPDGSVVTTGALIDKRWRVENNGTCNWDAQFRLKLVAGSELGARVEQALYPARSGTQATIRIIFTAPQEPGAYRSAWQAFSPAGAPFGDPIFIDILVETPDSN